ncbi:MAG: hypothetical protein DK306_001896 [Chloroflexi bacterium]|nr:MAG: hypothetical protein DK306_001896 [Chloroflexota bacterium]
MEHRHGLILVPHRLNPEIFMTLTEA